MQSFQLSTGPVTRVGATPSRGLIILEIKHTLIYRIRSMVQSQKALILELGDSCSSSRTSTEEPSPPQPLCHF